MFLRYRLIQDLTQGMDTGVNKVSKVNMVIGVVAALGLSIVGNFQVRNKEIKKIKLYFIFYLSLRIFLTS